jgi:hypothetical protein
VRDILRDTHQSLFNMLMEQDERIFTAGHLVTTDKLAIASLEEVIKDLEKLSVGNEMKHHQLLIFAMMGNYPGEMEMYRVQQHREGSTE